MNGKRSQIMASKTHMDILNEAMVGQKITEVRWLTKEQTEDVAEHWYNQPIQITLENGVKLIPMSDDEGNEAGAISTNIPKMETIWVERD
jgi:galactose-1-phosphate uridylyltransferase